MQLRVARLCLDCEEVHAELQCPVCASDSYAYLSRWVPVEERRARTGRRRTTAPVEEKRGPRRARWVAGGALSLAAAFAASRWLRQSRAAATSNGLQEPAGDGEPEEPLLSDSEDELPE